MGVDISGRKPKTNEGDYFSSNWWGWRPILAISEAAMLSSKLDYDTSYWGSNDGKGLRTQKQCNRLADSLELMLNDNFPKEFMADNSNVIYTVTGSWDVTDTCEITPDEEADLNEQYEFGTILWAPVLTKKGVLVETTYSCSLEDIKEWINFLN